MNKTDRVHFHDSQNLNFYYLTICLIDRRIQCFEKQLVTGHSYARRAALET